MLDDIIEAALELILEFAAGDKLDEKWEEIKKNWRKRRERRVVQQKNKL